MGKKIKTGFRYCGKGEGGGGVDGEWNWLRNEFINEFHYYLCLSFFFHMS